MRKFVAVSVLALLLMPAAKAGRVTPKPDMTALQARQAILAAANFVYIPVKHLVWETIDGKSVRVSQRSIVFDGLNTVVDVNADQSNARKHHYMIRFANFTSVSAECSGTKCDIVSEPAGALLRNEAGEPISRELFISGIGSGWRKPCSAACHKIALDFANALNSLRALAMTRQTASSDFHQEAAAWRALPSKPPVPEEVRVQRLLAESAVREKNLQKALNEYETGLGFYPTWPQGYFNAALIAAELGFYADAVEHMQSYLELVPDAPDAQSARDQIVIWRDKAGQPALKY